MGGDGRGGAGVWAWLWAWSVVAVGVCVARPQREPVNHVEDHYLEDALGQWLLNFPTYTFMLKQDLDPAAPPHHHHHHHEEQGEEGEEVEGEEEEVEGEEGWHEEDWNAPISVVLIQEPGLLNPKLDYEVVVESLVAEAGNVFLSLSKYQNKTGCGVGGLTREHPSPPQQGRAGRAGRGGGGARRPAIGRSHNETIITFDLETQGNRNGPRGQEGGGISEWEEVSPEFWWASGRLESEGRLSLSFIPPECGCLSLSTYYALGVGNVTLVVGPQAYPTELKMLLCVNDLTSGQESDDYEEEEDDEYDHKTGDLTPGSEGEEEEEEAGEGDAIDESNTRKKIRPGRRMGRRGNRQMLRKKRRQQRRKKIRQAGRRQARKQARQNIHRNEGHQNHRQRGNGQQARKHWRKLQRLKRRRQRINRLRNTPGVTRSEDDNAGNSTMDGIGLEGQNSTHLQPEYNLFDLLLGNTSIDLTENETMGEEEEAEAGNIQETNEAEAGENEEEEEEGEGRRGRQGRPRRRQKLKNRKLRRMQKKRAHSPGDKFCCNQGIEQKKYILINRTNEAPSACNASSNEIVTTFANHKFSIDPQKCQQILHTCCFKFTKEIWDGIESRKAARKMKRKQRRQSRRQQRKHTRKERRRNRMNHIQHQRKGEEEENSTEA